MNTRSGYTGLIPTTVSLIIILANIAIGVAYTAETIDQIDLNVNELYETNAGPAEILSAPCATESRGVFRNSSITAGEFHCVEPMHGIAQLYELEWNTTLLVLEEQDPGVEISKGSLSSSDPLLKALYGMTTKDKYPQRYGLVATTNHSNSTTIGNLSIGGAR